MYTYVYINISIHIYTYKYRYAEARDSFHEQVSERVKHTYTRTSRTHTSRTREQHSSATQRGIPICIFVDKWWISVDKRWMFPPGTWGTCSSSPSRRRSHYLTETILIAREKEKKRQAERKRKRECVFVCVCVWLCVCVCVKSNFL